MVEGKMTELLDARGDRVVKEVSAPPHRPMSRELLFNKKGLPNWVALKEHFLREGRLSREDALKIITDTTNVFKKEPNILRLDDPVTVVGDIHGQFYDVPKILDLGGDPEAGTKYLFLGDYVDRGSFSVEVLLTLYSLKLNYPDQIAMLRGNHECRQMTAFFNFKMEVEAKYDESLYDTIMESFDALPLSCIVNDKFIAIHGGISPELKSLKDIKNINRFSEPPKQGLFCDLLWSDPVEDDNGKCDPVWKSNEVRGCSYFFGVKVANKFLEKNDLLCILRAHEAQVDGYKMHRWNGPGEFPVCITIFSAPNYCDVYNNKAAIIKLNNNTMNIQQFNYTAHPYILPNFLNVFSWSIPFVSEKVMEILLYILQLKGKDDKKTPAPVEIEQVAGPKKADVLRNKIKAVSRMVRMFKTLREESELVTQLKGLCPDNRIPRGLLLEGKDALRDAVEAFQSARKWDAPNEMRPKMG